VAAVRPAAQTTPAANERDPRSAELRRLLEARVGAGAGEVLARSRAAVVLDAGEGDCWTVAVNAGRVSVREGRPRRRVDTTICATLPVLVDVVAGTRAGVEAFLAGELNIRGNMALALALDGVLADEPRPARHPRSRMVLANGIRTSYLEAGPVDAPPIVLVHGLGATNASMLTLLWDLAADYHVISPDLPGHGATEAVTDTYDADFLARWLLAFLDATKLEQPFVIGNSLGGRTALEAALISPERIRGLVLLAPAMAFRKLRQFIPVVNALRPELARLPLRFSRKMAGLGLKAMFAVPRRVPDPWFVAAGDEFVRVMRMPAHRIAFFCALRQVYLDEAFGERGFWSRLPRLAPPALFIWGDSDRLVPWGFARHVEQAVPAARSVVLESCGHVPHFEHPERTCALVREFLTAVCAPAKLPATAGQSGRGSLNAKGRSRPASKRSVA
jgi:pimeloyl-ACP methyl ester carboxylesterase